MPVNDLKPHLEGGTYCHCKPRLQEEANGTIVIHNAYDGREFYEEDEKEVLRPREVYGDDGAPDIPWNGHPMEIKLTN